MKCLSYDEFIDIMNCLLTDGAENVNTNIVHVLNTTYSDKVCGYGNMVMKPGKYLLVWDNIDENDQQWPTMYAYVNSHNDFEKYDNGEDCKFDILLSNDEDDNDGTCVCIFKLTEE